MKRLVLSFLTLFIVNQAHLANADINSDTEQLLNWAENNFPQFFPSHQATQNINPWLFRHYSETGVYAGVNTSDNHVYLLGGPWGDNVTVVDSLSNLLAIVGQSNGNTGIPACDTTQVPSGMAFTQNGNVVNVTTNGQCIAIASSSALCVAPRQSSQTGISVLTNTAITESSMSGITMAIPGYNPLESLANAGSGKHCTINAPSETQNLIINQDICLDVTAQFQSNLDALQNLPGITITPPITVTSKGTTTGTIVADCFATDADSISDAYTGEAWINQNGTFVKYDSFVLD